MLIRPVWILPLRRLFKLSSPAAGCRFISLWYLLNLGSKSNKLISTNVTLFGLINSLKICSVVQTFAAFCDFFSSLSQELTKQTRQTKFEENKQPLKAFSKPTFVVVIDGLLDF